MNKRKDFTLKIKYIVKNSEGKREKRRNTPISCPVKGRLIFRDSEKTATHWF